MCLKDDLCFFFFSFDNIVVLLTFFLFYLNSFLYYIQYIYVCVSVAYWFPQATILVFLKARSAITIKQLSFCTVLFVVVYDFYLIIIFFPYNKIMQYSLWKEKHDERDLHFFFIITYLLLILPITNAWGFCRTNLEQWRRRIATEVDLYQQAVLIVTVLVWIFWFTFCFLETTSNGFYTFDISVCFLHKCQLFFLIRGVSMYLIINHFVAFVWYIHLKCFYSFF